MRNRAWLGFLCIAMALVLDCGEKPRSEPRRQTILILMDAARADRFGYAGYDRDTTPAIDALAARGSVYLNHYAHDTDTRASLPSLLYSRYFTKSLFPASDSVPFDSPQALMRRLDDEAISLPRALANDGFTTAAISAHSWIKKGTPFAEEFGELQDLSVDLHRYAPPAEAVVDRAIDWIEGHQGEDYFLYLHMMDTHFPHAFNADARHFFGPGEPPRSLSGGIARDKIMGRPIEPDERRYLDAIYDGSLRYNDREIERLVSFLRDGDLLDETLIVITADHGEHLLEVPGRFTHGGPWFEWVSRIPLLIHYPKSVAPARVEGRTGLVDVSPTILRLMEVPLPQGKNLDGNDLHAVAVGEREESPYAFSRWGVVGEEEKIILRNGESILAATEPAGLDQVDGDFYDLSSDPDERNDAWNENPESAKRLVNLYRDTLQSKYQRFVNSVNHELPPTSFAISSKDFRSEDPIVDVPQGASLDALRAMTQTTDWMRRKHWRLSWFAAREQAPPIKIEFRLPNGRYQVSAHIRGEGEIALSGSLPVAVAGPAYEPGATMPTDPVEIGVVEVKDEVFRVTLHPKADGSSMLWLKMLGFRPLGGDADDVQSASDAKEQLEQLRALGYVD